MSSKSWYCIHIYIIKYVWHYIKSFKSQVFFDNVIFVYMIKYDYTKCKSQVFTLKWLNILQKKCDKSRKLTSCIDLYDENILKKVKMSNNVTKKIVLMVKFS